jgi:hypothetical protein
VKPRAAVSRSMLFPDEAPALVGDVLQSGELIAAALDRRDERDAGRAHRHVGAGGADRDLLMREVVLIEACAAGAFGCVHALGDDAVLAANAEAFVRGLLALVAAAHVEAPHPDAGRLRQRGPQVVRRGHRRELRAAEFRSNLRGLGIDHRRCRADGHRLVQGSRPASGRPPSAWSRGPARCRSVRTS